MIEDTKYEDIIASIAGVAAFKVQGVASLSSAAGMRGKSQRRAPKSITVALSEGNNAVIDIYINAFSGVSVPDLAYDIQQTVTEEVESATKFSVMSVNVHVAGIVFNQ